MATVIIVTEEFLTWYSELTEAEQESVRPVVTLLEEFGVTLSFPHSSSIKGSRIAMRELRVQHTGNPYRILYVFDPQRQAVLLVGGDKAGDERWYERAVPLAEKLYAEYLRDH